MPDAGIYYDEEDDRIVFFYECECADGSYTSNKISINREDVLRELSVMAADYGEFFSIFEDDGEETEMVFLQPPTRDCVFEGEEE